MVLAHEPAHCHACANQRFLDRWVFPVDGVGFVPCHERLVDLAAIVLRPAEHVEHLNIFGVFLSQDFQRKRKILNF